VKVRVSPFWRGARQLGLVRVGKAFASKVDGSSPLRTPWVSDSEDKWRRLITS
jgi:hypothetical protein